jgi:hypothetical protein
MKIKILLFTVLLIVAYADKSYAQITILEDIKCNGDTTGAIIANPVNWGTPPYTYLWNNGETSQALHNLGAGNYSVTITDSDIVSPDSVFSIALGEPAAIVITADAIIPSDCDGHNNGGAQITVAGGIAPYEYHWREINFDSVYYTQDISNVRGGDYEIKVTDNWGCVRLDTITIPNTAFVPVTINYQAYICNGALSAVSILADSADSLQYFHYYWSSTYNTGDFLTNDSVFSTSTSFLAGNYTITVSDLSTGCANYYNVNINQSATPMVVTETFVPNACYGGHAGSISLHVNGGDPLPTYQCAWTGPNSFVSTAFSLSGLAAGTYNYTVTDDSACSHPGTIIIDQPYEPIKFYPTVNSSSCLQNNDGSVAVTPENIFWSPYHNVFYLYDTLGNFIDSISTGEPIGNLSSGYYTGIIINELGCTATNTIFIDKLTDACFIIPNLVTANGDGVNDVFRVDGGCNYDEFQVVIFTDLGKKVFESQDCNFIWDPNEVKASANTVFYYYIKVVDSGSVKEFRNSININY